jgi:hypothetical protein
LFLNLTTPRNALYALVGYLSLLILIKLFMFAGLSNDDSEQLLYSQSFQLVYDVKNPPLYTWLLYTLQAILPPSALSVSTLKYSLIAACYLLIYFSGREAGFDHKWALTFALSPLTIHLFAWDTIRHYSHSVLLTAACTATLYAFVVIARRPSIRTYGLLLGAIFMGCFAKYNYFIFATSVVVAAAILPDYRRVIIDRRFVVVVILAAVVLAPYGLAVREQSAALMDVYRSKFSPGAGPHAFTGIIDALYSGFIFLLPFLLVFPLVFAKALRRPRSVGQDEQARLGFVSLLALFNLMILLAILLLTFVSGTSVVRNHLFFISYLTPVALLSWLALRTVEDKLLYRFWAICVVIAALVPVVLVSKLFTDGANEAKKAYFNVPYKALAARIGELGFTSGMVVADDNPYPISGNLRVYLTQARHMSLKYDYSPPAAEPGACFIVWESGRQPELTTQTLSKAYLRLSIPEDAEFLAGEIRLPMAYSSERILLFSYRYFPTGAGTCS